MSTNLALVISDGLIDALAIAGLVALIVVLSLWGRRSRASPPTDVQVRASYATTLAGLGWRLVGVSIDHIDRHLFRLVVRLEPGPLAEDDLTIVRATATLVGLNAMDRWPTLTTFETRIVPGGGHDVGQQIVGLERGRDIIPPQARVRFRVTSSMPAGGERGAGDVRQRPRRWCASAAGRGSRTVLVTLSALMVLGSWLVARSPANAQTTETVVTLTFDDGTASQMVGARTLDRHDIDGTFYVVSGSVGAPGYVTRADLDALVAAGHEIGGHTVTHPDLTAVPIDEARRQVCNERATLTDWGYRVTSFAYPYAAHNETVRGIAAECGYNSARTLGELASSRGCLECAPVEAIPPADAYGVRAPDGPDRSWTLAELQDIVTTAEQAGGGWVPFAFHQICDGCSPLAVSPSVLDGFAAWLKQRSSLGTVVRTVDNVVAGDVNPVVTAPPAASSDLVNPSLEAAASSSVPDCWMTGGWGSNVPIWTRTMDAHTGLWAQRLDIVGYVDGDAKLLPRFDLGACSPSVVAGSTYTLGTWYKSTGIVQYALYYRTSSNAWMYWTSSPWFDPATDWTQAIWATPPVPDGVTAVSFGLALIEDGSLTTDDYSFVVGNAHRPGRTYPVHTDIVATTFWVGEIHDPSAPDGSQVISTYDSQWMQNYGGCDGVIVDGVCGTEARTAANGYFPTRMVPRQNPFYLDLPFDDLNDPIAFAQRAEVVPWADDPGFAGKATDPNFSFLKNRWVKLINGDRTCYGQIEDAGPGQYHDTRYVFGADDARPANREFNGAGLDVSPALNGCLGFGELNGASDTVDWQFVDDADVPPGPWLTIVTSQPVVR